MFIAQGVEIRKLCISLITEKLLIFIALNAKINMN